ncbi:hypothetical protein BAE44_0003582 [Dichanthelium oligosanthes]|uniref:Uncharacterized protein n=1 Tax=Dichanthelium oligosanthes TaxID=888268 RepID=A0A1E5WD99_9POAL|nr:hypothetical protein BAE44_0003582 [Dichanthelium oligosanthes]
MNGKVIYPYWLGTHPPFTVDNISRPGCDHEKQSDVLYKIPDAKLRGSLPIRLFPAFISVKSDEHYFGSDYNLADKSQSMLPFSEPLSH